MRNADAALYRAKLDGRGTWRVFEPDKPAGGSADAARDLATLPA
jgi:hypothetical protein